MASGGRGGALALAAASVCWAQVTLSGRVVDEHEAPVAGARVSVQAPQRPAIEASTGPAGTFQVTLPALGIYLVSIERPGYFSIVNRPADIQKPQAEMTLVLSPQREVFQSVEVGESPSRLDPEQTNREQRLSGTEINDIPYPSSHSLRNAMRLMPGVIEDPTGGVHFHGGAEYQTQYTLNGFDISDPIDGHFSTRLAVEGVRSLDLVSSRESPQYGRGSAGTLVITTENGTDQFHYTATNFVPGLDTHGGGLHLGDWTPRASLSGPLKKGRAWFSDSFNGEYASGFVNGLPKGQDTNLFWTAGNLFHTQFNLTPANILYADVLTEVDRSDRAGLGVLDPVSTTKTQRGTEWVTAVKDTYSWPSGALLEAGLAWLEVNRRGIPQGNGLYILTPEGRQGDYFVNSTERGRREEQFLNFYPPAFRFAGRHQLQIGEDFQHLDYKAEFQRSGYEVVGLSGLPLFETTFHGNGNFDLPNNSLAGYVNDHWQPLGRLTIDAGLREFWDELVGQAALAPRIAAAYSPFGDANTKLDAGYAVIHDATNLSLFSRPLDQQGLTVPFSPQGVPGTPLVSSFVRGSGLRIPRYGQWSAGVEHSFPHRLYARAEWLRKRGTDGFVYLNENGAGPIIIQPQVLGYGFGGAYALTNRRRDNYDEVALTVRQTLPDQFGWMASYVHSRAVSNAVLDPTVDQPTQVVGNFVPVPWDAPNRLLGWGYLPLYGKNWAVAFLVDYRTGFPFSVIDQAGRVAGGVNSRRFPSNFDLNLHLERRFTFRGYRFGLRVGFNNLTDHRNPTAVNNVIGAPAFLQFVGDEGRHAVVRIRFFGRAKS